MVGAARGAACLTCSPGLRCNALGFIRQRSKQRPTPVIGDRRSGHVDRSSRKSSIIFSAKAISSVQGLLDPSDAEGGGNPMKVKVSTPTVRPTERARVSRESHEAERGLAGIERE